MDNTLEQLAQYVSQQLRQGVSEQNIRASLAQNRWTQDWINAVFNVVYQNPGRFQPQQTTSQLAPVEVEHPSGSHVRSAPNPYPLTAQPAQAQQSSQSRLPTKKSKHLWPIIITAIVLIGLAVGAYFLFQAKKNQPAVSQDTSKQEQKQVKTSDEERKDDLNTLLSDLADLFVANGHYPTYESLKSAEFAAQNASFDTKAFADPKWSADNIACTAAGKAIMAAKPTEKCYAYSVVSSDGAACDNVQALCLRMTVAIILEDGKPYTVTLERNTEVEN